MYFCNHLSYTLCVKQVFNITVPNILQNIFTDAYINEYILFKLYKERHLVEGNKNTHYN